MKYVLRNCTVEAKKLEYNTDSQKEVIAWVNGLQDKHNVSALDGHDGGVVLRYNGDRVVANTGSYVVLDSNGFTVLDGALFEKAYMQSDVTHPKSAVEILQAELHEIDKHADYLEGKYTSETKHVIRQELKRWEACKEKLLEALALLNTQQLS